MFGAPVVASEIVEVDVEVEYIFVSRRSPSSVGLIGQFVPTGVNRAPRG